MNSTTLLRVAAGIACVSGVLAAAPAQATTEHCSSSTYPTKVELVDGGTSAFTGLAPGTEVCIKAGTRTTIVVVDDNGYITQGAILNRPGNAYLGISYYAYGDEYVCVDDPDTYEDECDPYGGGS